MLFDNEVIEKDIDNFFDEINQNVFELINETETDKQEAISEQIIKDINIFCNDIEKKHLIVGFENIIKKITSNDIFDDSSQIKNIFLELQLLKEEFKGKQKISLFEHIIQILRELIQKVDNDNKNFLEIKEEVLIIFTEIKRIFFPYILPIDILDSFNKRTPNIFIKTVNDYISIIENWLLFLLSIIIL